MVEHKEKMIQLFRQGCKKRLFTEIDGENYDYPYMEVELDLEKEYKEKFGSINFDRHPTRQRSSKIYFEEQPCLHLARAEVNVMVKPTPKIVSRCKMTDVTYTRGRWPFKRTEHKFVHFWVASWEDNFYDEVEAWCQKHGLEFGGFKHRVLMEDRRERYSEKELEAMYQEFNVHDIKTHDRYNDLEYQFKHDHCIYLKFSIPYYFIQFGKLKVELTEEEHDELNNLYEQTCIDIRREVEEELIQEDVNKLYKRLIETKDKDDE